MCLVQVDKEYVVRKPRTGWKIVGEHNSTGILNDQHQVALSGEFVKDRARSHFVVDSWKKYSGFHIFPYKEDAEWTLRRLQAEGYSNLRLAKVEYKGKCYRGPVRWYSTRNCLTIAARYIRLVEDSDEVV